MKIFISWHGKRSRETAEFLKKWIRQVIQFSEPWISTDIGKGSRWNNEIAKELENSDVGIICLYKENLKSEWIHFEAGALSKINKSHVCTFLIDLKPADIAPPIAQFQHTQYDKEDIRKMVYTINGIITEKEDRKVNEKDNVEIFEQNWDKLDKFLSEIKNKKYVVKGKERSERELIEESIEISRKDNTLLNKIYDYLMISDSSSGI